MQVGALDPEAEAECRDPRGEIVHERTGIPYKSASGRPVVPILPLYFSRDPDTPLRGYSLHRTVSLDQFREMNVMRTYQAQGVRRMARQWMVRAGFLSEDSAAKIAQGLDGEFVEVDLAPGADPRAGNILPVPQAPIPGDIAASTQPRWTGTFGTPASWRRSPVGEVTKSHGHGTEPPGRLHLLRAWDGWPASGMRSSPAWRSTYNVMLSVVLGR